MTDKDNLLLESFFKEAARQQIEDNGFTERVMSSLNGSSVKVGRQYLLYSNMWTLFCIAIAAILFFVFGGMDMLRNSILSLCHTVLTWISVFITTAPTAEVHLDPVVLVLVLAFVLVFLPYQTYRRLSATL